MQQRNVLIFYLAHFSVELILGVTENKYSNKSRKNTICIYILQISFLHIFEKNFFILCCSTSVIIFEENVNTFVCMYIVCERSSNRERGGGRKRRRLRKKIGVCVAVRIVSFFNKQPL